MKLTKILLEKADSKEKEIANDIISVLNEGDFNSVIQKMKSYAKKGLLTMAIVTMVAQGVQANGNSNDAKQVYQAGIELVQQNKQSQEKYEPTQRAQQIIKKVAGEKEYQKLVEKAQKEGLYIGVGSSRQRNISMQKAQSDAIASSGIEGKAGVSRGETKFYRDGSNVVTVAFYKINK